MDSDATFSGGDLIIYVANTVEGTAYDFVRQLPSAERHAVIRKDQLLGERALFWGGDNVLVLTSLPAKPSFCNYAKEVMGCDRLANDWPQEAGIALSAAVMADDCLMDRVSDLIKKGDATGHRAICRNQRVLGAGGAPESIAPRFADARKLHSADRSNDL
jgi:hypothetical protein